MAEEVQLNSPQEDSDVFGSLDQSRLATVLIGILVVLAGYLMYSYFSTPQTETNEIAGEVQNAETLGETEDSLGSINEEGNLETPEEVASDSTEDVGATSSEGTYVVQPGDSLWKIAEAKFDSGFVWVDLARANNIPAANAGQLEVGQELVLPALGAAEGTVTTRTGGETRGQNYTVEKGDTLWEIAREFYGSGHNWVRIYDHPSNDVTMYTAVTTGRTYPRIEVGQELVIPAMGQGV